MSEVAELTTLIERVWDQAADLASRVSNHANVAKMTGPEALRYFSETLKGAAP